MTKEEKDIKKLTAVADAGVTLAEACMLNSLEPEEIMETVIRIAERFLEEERNKNKNQLNELVV